MTVETYVVTGIPRSGTTALATALRAARGIDFGADLNAELEPVDLATCLTVAMVQGLPVAPAIDAYIASRGPGDWGVKSPSLLPYLGDFDAALARAGRLPARVFVTTRPLEDALASLRRVVEGQDMPADHAALLENLFYQLTDHYDAAFDRADVLVPFGV